MDKNIMVLAAIVGGIALWGFTEVGGGYLVIFALGGFAISGTQIMTGIQARKDARHWNNYELEERRLQIESLRYDVEQKKLDSRYQTKALPGGLLVWNAEGDIRCITAHGAKKAADNYPSSEDKALAAPQEPDTPQRGLFEIIDEAVVIALIGGQGAGKSTLLKAMVQRWGGNALIIDAHGDLSKVDYGCTPVGAGRKYAEIQAAFDWLADEIQRRYNGESPLTPLVVFCDEFTKLRRHIKGLDDLMESVLTEVRKINIRCVFCSHSKRAEIWGLKGKYDLADGIFWLSLKKSLMSGARSAEIEYAGEKAAVEIPHIPESRLNSGFNNVASQIKLDSYKNNIAGSADPQAPLSQKQAHAPQSPEPAPEHQAAPSSKPQELTGREQMLYDILSRNNEPQTARNLAEETGLTEGNIRKILSNMKGAGYVTNVSRGYYSAVI